MALVLAGTVPVWVLDYPDTTTGAAAAVGLYTVAAHAPDRRAAYTWSGIFLLVIAVVAIAGVLAPDEELTAGEMAEFMTLYAVAGGAR